MLDALTRVEDVDMVSAPKLTALVERLLQSRNGVVVLSFEECPYFSSSGLGVLIRLRRSFEIRTRIVVPECHMIERVLDATGTRSFLRTFASVPEALAAD